MFSTKEQVDRHARTLLAKLRNENERHQKGFVLAKLYLKIGEYASAQHYVSGYLSVNEASPHAHKLLGDCYIHLRQPERALASYQRSLQLDSKQSDLIIKACSLILAEDLDMVKNKAKYWCEMATNERVQHESVFNLKLKLLGTHDDANKDSKQVEVMIMKEINSRPQEVTPRLQLVQYFLTKNRYADAFKYILDVQSKSQTQFGTCKDWLAMMAKTLALYKESLAPAADVTLSKNWDYWHLSAIVVERQLALSLTNEPTIFAQQMANLSECQHFLCEFDQLLSDISRVALSSRPELTAQLMLHYEGQFCLQVASFLFKRERIQNNNQWSATTVNALPMLLIAFHAGIPDTEEPWLKKTAEPVRELVRFWQRSGAFRCVQAGKSFVSCIKTDDSTATAPFESLEDLCDATRKQCSSKTWRQTLYRTVFSAADHLAKMTTSHFVHSASFEEPIVEAPTSLKLDRYARIAESLQTDSLAQSVYLYLHADKLAGCDFQLNLQGLEFTAANIYNCNASTLNKLDMETFLVATIMQTRSRLAVARSGLDGTRPRVLPFANYRSSDLCTEQQARWWQLAVNSIRNVSGTDDVWNAKQTIEDGIEAVRCVGNAKMELMIALQVADVLRQKLQTQTLGSSEFTKKAYEHRAENIYRSALAMLKNQSTTAGLNEGKGKLFKYHSKATDEELQTLSDGALIFLAEFYFKRGEWDTCIDLFTGLQLPYATYYIAEAYKRRDETNQRNSGHQDKVKEYLGQTQKLLSKLKVPKNHPLRVLVKNDLKQLQLHDLHNSSYLSEDDDLNVSAVTGFLHRSRRQDDSRVAVDSTIVDQLTNLASLVQQLTIQNTMLQSQTTTLQSQNTMLQSEMSDIKKMLLQQPKEAAAPAPVALPHPTDPYNDYLTGRYAAAAMMAGAYQQMPFAVPYTGVRGPTPIYGYAGQPDPAAALPLTQSTPQRGPISAYESMMNLATAAAQPHHQQPPPSQHVQQYYNPTSQPPPSQQQQPLGVLATPPQVGVPRPSDPKAISQALAGNANFMKTWNSTYNNEPVEKSAPVNVVITSSDPVPHCLSGTVNSVPQPLLSVTIPPQHIKNYTGPVNIVNSNRPEHSHNLLPTTIMSTMVAGQQQAAHDTSAYSEDRGSATEEEDEVDVDDDYGVSSEEHDSSNEIIYFSGLGKLFWLVDERWSELGEGEIKIAKTTDRVCLTMHQDQTGKLCANHELMPATHLMFKDNYSCMWLAHDVLLSEDKTVKETFCARFKAPELAGGFREAFESATDTPDKASAEVPTNIAPPSVLESTFKFSFGGMALSKPEASKVVEAVAAGGGGRGQSEAVKPNPFAGFSFGSTTTAATTAAGGGGSDDAAKPFSSIFSNMPKPFSSGGSNLFGAAAMVTQTPLEIATNKSQEATLNRAADGDAEEEYVPTAKFEPVIPLPSLVEVKTGEEDEHVAFEHPATLLRFDTETKEWKERGRGNIRILVKKDDPSQVRLLMRREKVLKLACNQRLSKDQVFKAMPNSDRALTWYAQDYADNELKPELFAIRFKTGDMCTSFLDAIREAQKKMDCTQATPAAEVKEPEKPIEKGFGEAFKPKAGSWECKVCYISNKGDVLHCAACDTPKDDTVPKKDKAASKGAVDLSQFSTSKFSFGFNPTPVKEEAPPTVAPNTSAVSAPTLKANGGPGGFGDAFKPKPGTWECKACYITNKADVLHCVSCSTPKDDTVPKKEASFGLNAASKSSLTFGTTGFSFGSGTTNTFSFGSAASPFTVANATANDSTPPSTVIDVLTKAPSTDGLKEAFNLEASKSTFNFVFKPKSPGKAKSPLKLSNGEAGEDADVSGADDEHNIEEESTAYFTPVIPLPDKVEAKTGEEDETVLYSHRAKLFRFSDGEWRERGLGDVKILKHTETGKVRVVMRREQVLKICLNHILDHGVDYAVKDNKSWCFVVNDFSEGEFELMQFSIRFKTPELALEFKEAVDKALADIPADEDTAPEQRTESPDAEPALRADDANEDELKLMEELKLNADFLNYKNAPACPGCRGCDDETFVYQPLDQNPELIPDGDPLPLRLPESKKKPETKNIFAAFNQSLSFGLSDTSNKSGPTVGSGSTLFGSSTTPASLGGNIFGSFVSPSVDATPPAVTETAAPSGFFFSGANKGFGSTNANFSGGSLFGGSPFGATTTDTVISPPTTNIFGGAGGGGVKFGETAASMQPVFGEKTSLFGGAAPAAGTNIFGGAASGFKFGAALNTVETSDETPKDTEPKTFGSVAANAVDESQPEAGKDIFKMDENFSFATLAQSKTDEDFAKTGAAASDTPNPAGGFFGLSNTQDFRHFNSAYKNGTHDDSKENGGDEGEHDPHYDPIIALPDEIVVSTGEEDETKLFGERGKLYRFDSNTKEWKERGVGEFKILHHPGRRTYRFLMRREQIFMLVLNHTIGPDFVCNPMDKSGKSYCWAALNHAEGTETGELEQLAIKFGKVDIASKFERTVNECIEQTKAE